MGYVVLRADNEQDKKWDTVCDSSCEGAIVNNFQEEAELAMENNTNALHPINYGIAFIYLFWAALFQSLQKLKKRRVCIYSRCRFSTCYVTVNHLGFGTRLF